MVLAGGWGTCSSRPASTWPLSRSATIQVWAGPSGIGTEPIGCMLSADDMGAGAAPTVAPTASTAATAAISLRMAAESNFRARGRLFSPTLRCMLSLAEISDRLEIEQLLVDYSTAIDQRRFDDLDKVFT